MNAKPRIRIFFTLSLLALIPARAPAATITWLNSEGSELEDSTGTLLYPGTAAGAHDGDLIQLGYYSMGTTSSPFNGVWTVLVKGSIGDNDGNLPGRFGYYSEVSADAILPGVPLAIRFYDAPSLEEAKFFNAVTDHMGRWNGIDGDMTLSLQRSSLVWLGGKISGYATTIAVPEPYLNSLICLGGFLALSFRKPRIHGRTAF